MSTIAKVRISQLPESTSVTANAVVPVSDGFGSTTTYKITPNDLIKDTDILASKANLSGGNEISGPQDFLGAVSITGLLRAKSDVMVDGDMILNKSEQIQFTDGSEFPVSNLYFLNDVTHDIQAQFSYVISSIALKAPLASPSFTGTATIPTANIASLSVSSSASVPAGTSPGHAVNKSQLDLKSNISGGNAFEGDQSINGNLSVSGMLIVDEDISSTHSITTSAISINNSLELQEGSSILYDSNPIQSEKLLYIKNLASDAQAQLGSKANVESPNFTGNPTASTQPVTDNSTRLATTSFVDKKIDSKLERVYVVDDGINPIPAASAPGMDGKLLYESTSKKLRRSDGIDWIEIIPDTTIVYLFVSEDCHDFKNKIYIWDGSKMI